MRDRNDGEMMFIIIIDIPPMGQQYYNHLLTSTMRPLGQYKYSNHNKQQVSGAYKGTITGTFKRLFTDA